MVTNPKESSDADDGEFTADLRKETRQHEETEAKKRAYNDLQRQMSDGNMSMLDRIRYEVDNS